MPFTPRALLRAAGAALFLALPATLASTVLFPTEATAQTKKAALPAPYVSKALGAVLIEVTPEVRKAFNLKKKKQGVLILSVQPGGVAAKQGLKPGDVIDNLKKGGKGGTKASDKSKGKKVRKPQDLDAILLYWLNEGYDGFYFVGSRGGVYFLDYGTVTLDEYYYVYDLTTVSSWDSEWYGASYAYEEYSYSYSETITTYSEEITESYEYSETYAEEMTSSEEFVSELAEADVEMTAEEVSEETAINEDLATDPEEDAGTDATDDQTDTATMEDGTDQSSEEPADETTEAAAVDDESAEPATEDSVEATSDEPAEDYGTCDCSDPDCANPECSAIEDEPAYSEPAVEDTSADEDPGYDDSGYDDGGVDDSGGDAGYDDSGDSGGDDGGSEEYVE